MASKTAKTVKEVTFIARCEFKCDRRKVVYLVRSSNGVDQYETSMFDGKATGCTCKAKGRCYHMKGAEQKEAARPFAAKRLPEWTIKLVNTGKLVVPAKTEKPVKVAKTKKVESSTIQPIESVKVAEIAQTLDIAIEEVQKIAALAIEHKQEMKPKHTDLCLPIGPRDTKKDWTKAALTRNAGFSLMK